MQNHSYRFYTFAEISGMFLKPFHSLIITTFLLVFFAWFSPKGTCQSAAGIAGDLVIFHAGSLSVPFREIAAEFKKLHPEVNILMEAAGSVASARKITDLGKPCDIMASADYSVIDNMLVPKFADWNIKFAGNEMCVVYSEKARYASQVNSGNWTEILQKPYVAFGRSDPNSDPCGYRTVMMLQLAEKYYKKPGLKNRFLQKDQIYMRPKETDLLALIETGTVDYIFIYRSVAVQHKLKFLTLPDQINLKNPDFASEYASAKVEINGKKPGEKETMSGEPMVYSFTILRDAPNKAAALAFAGFLLSRDKGMKIMVKNGQPSVVPAKVDNYDKIPAELKLFVKK